MRIARLIAGVLLVAVPLPAVADSALQLGVRRDAPPFAWNDDGMAKGYSVTLCNRIADVALARGLYDRAEHVWVTSEDRFTLLRNGRIDLLCDALSVTLHRMREFEFTLFTFVSGASYMRRADGVAISNGELAGRKLGVLAGTTTQTLVAEGLSQEVPSLRKATGDGSYAVRSVTNHFDGLDELLAGEIDVYVADREILLALRDRARREARGELVVAERYFSFEPYALAVRRDDVELAFVANQVLVELFQSNAIADIFARSFPRKRMSESLKTLFSLQQVPVGSPER